MAETFETIKTKIGDWMGVDLVRLPDAVRGDCINLVQRKICRNHDLRFAEIVDTMALSAGTQIYALPADWRSPLVLWYTSPTSNSRVELTRVQKDVFDSRFPPSTPGGQPTHYTVWGSNFYFGPVPDVALTLNRNYYRFLPDLTDGDPNNTNGFVAQAWDVLFYGALEEAAKYVLEDSRAPVWGVRFIELEADLAGEHQRERSAGRIAQSREPG